MVMALPGDFSEPAHPEREGTSFRRELIVTLLLGVLAAVVVIGLLPNKPPAPSRLHGTSLSQASRTEEAERLRRSSTDESSCSDLDYARQWC
jgi:hypothetical protein